MKNFFGGGGNFGGYDHGWLFDPGTETRGGQTKQTTTQTHKQPTQTDNKTQEATARRRRGQRTTGTKPAGGETEGRWRMTMTRTMTRTMAMEDDDYVF